MSIRLEIPKWLAMNEKLPRFLEGKIIAETEKGLLFEGCGVIEKSIHCLRCGRELTHTVSRVVGYGPCCCERLGIPRPDLEDAEILAQQLREATAVRRWFPKSKTTVHGEYTITKAENVVPQIRLERGVLKVKCHYDQREIAKSVPGWSWNPNTKTWDFPAKAITVRQLVEAFEEEVDLERSVYDLKEERPVEVDQDFLFDFQKDGAQFLVDHERVLLADEMGLGKTVQAISACQARQGFPVLVLCPNTLKWTWSREIQKWAPEATIQIVDGGPTARQDQLSSNADYVIVNLELLTYDRKSSGKNRPWSEDVKLLLRRKWNTVILDEAHRVKNRKAQVTKAAKLITKKTDHVYLLTGTPILNRVEELWSLLNILYPKQFSSYWKFVEKFCYVFHDRYGYQVGDVRENMLPDLKRILEPIVLRRLKTEVLKDLPGMLPVKRVWVGLEGEQRRIYEEMAEEMYTKLESGETVSAAVVIAQITRLKQITIDENLMVADKNVPLSGAKVDALFDFLETCGDEKVVIFSQFSRVLDRLELVCQQKKIQYEKLTGKVTGSDREAAVEEFQTNSDCRLFLCGMKSGGMGITLTASHIAVFLDKFWSPTMNWQAQERLDRIGQTEKVTIVEFLAAQTVEEGIETMLAGKTKQFSSLFDLEKPDVEEIGPVEKQDLIELLRFGL